MGKITVWTRQHRDVLKQIEATGRYTAKREYIQMELQEHTDIMLEAYDWLVKNGPHATQKPADVEYPVWLSFVQDNTMLLGENGVILELSLDEDIITPVNVAKWGAILNYSYIPKDEADGKRHSELLKAYGTSDAKAYMTQFYPDIKREIIASWPRLFDESIQLGNDSKYGTIWEIKKEWITKIIQ